jgi:hypothetical protein
MPKKFIIPLLSLLGVLVVGIFLVLASTKSASCYVDAYNGTNGMYFDREKVRAEIQNQVLKSKFCLVNPKHIKTKGDLYVSILDPNGKTIASTKKIVNLNGDKVNYFTTDLSVNVPHKELMYHRLQYMFKYNLADGGICPPNTKCDKKVYKVEGIKSIYAAMNHLSLKMYAQNKYIEGAPASLRVIAFNPSTEEPLNNASVEIALASKDNNDILLYSGKTNDVGTVNANFEMPEGKTGNFDLKVKVAANIPERAVEEISEPISVKRDYKIMLTTDKPIYQPAQTMKIRVLTLNAGSLKPVQKDDAYIEVYDAKGNKVFKKKTGTNEFGIMSAEFTLADEINMGNYKIKAIVDNIDSEKTVKVSRYVLPKFKIVFDTNKEYYLPSETVKGTIDANYFFGKPLQSADIKISVDKYDIGFSQIQQIKGQTDADGHFDFEVTLPENFVGQQLASGNALVKFDIEITDTAEHTEKKSSSVMVSEQPINITVIPESGSLAKNIVNKIYVMTTYPDGSPAVADVTINLDDKTYTMKTDSTGIGTFETKTDKSTLALKAKAVDSKGNKAETKLSLSADPAEESVLLRADKAITRVGETVNLQALATKTNGTVYLDIIKNGQTILTKSMDLKKGTAEMALDIPPEMVGTVGINAYIINQSSEIIRDSKIIYVNPADDLVINVSADKKVYKPGEEAVINFKVTDGNKHPILAALGVYVVDESVFALSELQPGLEKVFFTLEEEILKPRYEIHGLTPGEIVQPVNEKPALAERQQEAAKVLFAAAEDLKNYDISVDTYTQNLYDQLSHYNNPLNRISSNLRNAVYKYYTKKNKENLSTKEAIDKLIASGYIQKEDIIDPWGQEVALVSSVDNSNYYYDYYIISKGPDGIAGTVDDIIVTPYYGMVLAVDLQDPSLLKAVFEGEKIQTFRDEMQKNYITQNKRRRGGLWPEEERFMMADAMEMPMAAGVAGVMGAAKPQPTVKMQKTKESRELKNEGMPKDDAAEVRVREYFPETLYANPSIITDNMGKASISIPMADSITTWRLSAMANSLEGLLGSNTAGIKVFQDFFIDIDLPVSLTEHDRVKIPIAIYNYLPEKQTIKLKMEKEDWFEALEGFEREVTLAANQVTVEYFPIEVSKLGNHTLTVYAYGSQMNDAIKRKVLVEPDGEEFRDAINGRLESKLTQTITIPKEAIDDASKILVKVYPGYLSQVVEGLDKILRMPSGCFEQTSSTTYPNILVLDYMKRTGQISPEIQMKAESYINSGYQRLLTFEVTGGGFEWFGKAPANKILTAYGLMEFYDMTAVHNVDPNILNRTQNWLVKQQEADGSWKPDEGGIAEGAINKYQGDTLRTTAYIGWALVSSGHNGPALDKAVSYIKKNLNNAGDAYTYAVIANLMVLYNADDPATLEVFNKLISMKTEKGDVIYWEQKEKTPMYGDGKTANIETTALAAIALINYGRDIATTNKALNYLIESKDTYGTWYSTQSTILAMKALLMSISDATKKVNADIAISINGKQIETFTLNDENYDVVQQIDLKNYTKKGTNDVTLSIDGEGSMLYQIVSIYYIPWELLDKPKLPPLTIGISYDKTTLEKNDIATANVIVQNNTKDTANMVIVDLGIPPGFEVQTEDLDKMVTDKVITKYSIAARQVILYFDKIKPSETVKFTYRVKAKISVKAKSGKSRVYMYYEPDVNNTAEPVEITVN